VRTPGWAVKEKSGSVREMAVEAGERETREERGGGEREEKDPQEGERGERKVEGEEQAEPEREGEVRGVDEVVVVGVSEVERVPRRGEELPEEDEEGRRGAMGRAEEVVRGMVQVRREIEEGRGRGRARSRERGTVETVASKQFGIVTAGKWGEGKRRIGTRTVEGEWEKEGSGGESGEGGRERCGSNWV
jgi:hypothetical protein